MPSGIVKNKVVGIYFEQKADYVSFVELEDISD